MRLLDPLARRGRLRVRLPAVGQDVAELVAELIGERRPVPFADVDDDPGHGAAVGMQPDRGRPGGVLVDAQPRRLAIGEETHAVETRVPHVLDNLVGGARQHATRIAGELDGRGQQRRGFDGRGELRHGRQISAARPRGAYAASAEDCGY